MVSTLESCFDEEGYASFVIDVTTRLLQHYKGTDRSWGIGRAIEHCFYAIGKSPRESNRFVEFCEAFAQAIEGYILTADDATNVVLPLSGWYRRKGPGISTIIKRVATTFCSMDRTGYALIELIGRPGLLGDARLTYSPSDPDYEDILRHLGGLRPGEVKQLQPWNDQPPSGETEIARFFGFPIRQPFNHCHRV